MVVGQKATHSPNDELRSSGVLREGPFDIEAGVPRNKEETRLKWRTVGGWPCCDDKDARGEEGAEDGSGDCDCS